MRAAAVMLFLSCAFGSAAQAGYSVIESGTAPLRSYVGDLVELRVRLRLAAPPRPAASAATLAAPKKLPSAPWMDLRQVRVSTVGGGEWDVRIQLVSFAPGPGRLPALDLGAIVLDGLSVQTSSILMEKKVDRLAPPREQLAIPGTGRRIAVAGALIIGGPAAGFLLAARLARVARAVRARRRRAQPWSRLQKALRRLRTRAQRVGGRAFYIELTAALRAYLERRHGMEATTATTRELRERLRRCRRRLPSARRSRGSPPSSSGGTGSSSARRRLPATSCSLPPGRPSCARGGWRRRRLGTLDHPLALALLLALPPLIWLVHFSRWRGARVQFAWRVWQGEGFAPGVQPARLLLLLSETAFWLGCALLVVALAGPQRVSRQKSYLSRGIDIMIVLDESPSMLAQDFKPDHRFDAARSVIREFIHGRENDPIGLVSFADQAALRVPPTVDYQLLLDALDSLTVGSLSDGTAIGMGLALASLHLSRSTAPGRVIILLTDGENNAGEIAPDDAAAAAARLGIRVHTVGIGREGEAPLVYTDPQTGRTVRGTYKGRFDEALLQRIARVSGGRYFHASSPGVLAAIFEAIDSYEKTEKRVKITVTRVPLHGRFVLAGLLLVLLRVVAGKALLREVF